jgi:hypothetical protein
MHFDEIADMPEYHNIFMASKTFDKLEVSAVSPFLF